MTLEQLMNMKDIEITESTFQEYVDATGLKKIKTKDLDKLIEKHGSELLKGGLFNEVYRLVTSIETSRTMERWTKAIGIMTLVMVFIAALEYLWPPK